MSEGVETMMATYEVSIRDLRGLPLIAVRAGRALERWGARAAQPVDADEQRIRFEAQREAQEAFEARRNGCFGIGTVLR